MLAGLILERAGGAPIAALARRDVLSAPGGDGLAFQPGERPARPHAHSYWYPDGLARPVDFNDRSGVLPRRSLTTMSSGAIGLAGDVPSLARWGSELLGGHVLEPSSLQEMQDVHQGGSGRATASVSPSGTSTTTTCGATRATASAPTPSSGTCRRSASPSPSPGTTT